MPDLSAANLPLVLASLVPGFVWWKVHRYFQISRSGEKQSWLGVFSLSAINYALWSWWIPSLWVSTAASMNALILSQSNPDFSEYLVTAETVPIPISGWMVITFFSPMLLGVATGYSQRTGWWRQLLIEKLGLNIPHPVDTAWEYIFGRGESLWTTVTLTDGSVVEGIFSRHSLASSRSGERDLYLEQYFERRENKLHIADHDSGIWIQSDMIKVIAFKKIRYKQSEE